VKLRRGGYRSRYRLRKQTVDPVFGQIKQACGFRQVLLRGITKVTQEWTWCASPITSWSWPRPLPERVRTARPWQDIVTCAGCPVAPSHSPPDEKTDQLVRMPSSIVAQIITRTGS